jgi:hypothetical protein
VSPAWAWLDPVPASPARGGSGLLDRPRGTADGRGRLVVVAAALFAAGARRPAFGAVFPSRIFDSASPEGARTGTRHVPAICRNGCRKGRAAASPRTRESGAG